MAFLLFIVAFAFGGAVIGTFWRWHLFWLLALCAMLGFTIYLVMRDWSDFDFGAIVADARAGGSSWVSWCVGLTTYFILFAGPAAVGAACGFALRQMRGRSCHK
jgi:hypothetical protein